MIDTITILRTECIISAKNSIDFHLLKMGKKGIDAYLLYHFYCTHATKQNTLSIKLDEQFYLQNLRWSKKRYQTAKSILISEKIIYNNTVNNTAQITKQKNSLFIPKTIKKLSPAKQMKKFLQSYQNSKHKTIMRLEEIMKCHFDNIAKNELDNFVEYWTELTKNGKRQKWELQKTFELSRRFKLWLKRSYMYNELVNNNVNIRKSTKYSKIGETVDVDAEN